MGAARNIKIKHYTKQVLTYLLVAGIITLAQGGPHVGWKATKKIFGTDKTANKRRSDTFRYLMRRGLIEWQRDGHDVAIKLTAEGKRVAGKYQIDELTLARPKKWDGKWRIVVFDIPNSSTFVRNVFRRKLKELGFYQLQKSIWVHPFECREEVALLREFLGATAKQIRFIEATKIERDDFLHKHFAM